MIYNAPEVKVLMALANVAATSNETDEEEVPDFVMKPPCMG